MTDLTDIGAVPFAEAAEGLSGVAWGVPIYSRGGTVRAFALVDLEDVAWATRKPWFVDRDGYVVYRDSGGEHRMARELLGLHRGDGRLADHMNRDKLDHRRANLRVLTLEQSAQNRSGWPRATSTYRGVTWSADAGRWRARGACDGRTRHIGYFESEQDAAVAAAAFRRSHMPFSFD